MVGAAYALRADQQPQDAAQQQQVPQQPVLQNLSLQHLLQMQNRPIAAAQPPAQQVQPVVNPAMYIRARNSSIPIYNNIHKCRISQSCRQV